VKWVTAFDPKALDAEVKKYSDDIGLVCHCYFHFVTWGGGLMVCLQILKGVKDESKLLAKFAKPDRR
jgi:hypothetical protein